MKGREVLEIEEDEVERGNWSGKLDFLLSCLGYAVGRWQLEAMSYWTLLVGGNSRQLDIGHCWYVATQGNELLNIVGMWQLKAMGY